MQTLKLSPRFAADTMDEMASGNEGMLMVTPSTVRWRSFGLRKSGMSSSVTMLSGYACTEYRQVPAAVAARTSVSKEFFLNEQHNEIVLLRRNDGDELLPVPNTTDESFVE